MDGSSSCGPTRRRNRPLPVRSATPRWLGPPSRISPQGAVEVCGCQRAMGSPGLAETANLALARHRLEPVKLLHRPTDPQVAGRQNVGSAELTEQDHVGGPGAD